MTTEKVDKLQQMMKDYMETAATDCHEERIRMEKEIIAKLGA